MEIPADPVARTSPRHLERLQQQKVQQRATQEGQPCNFPTSPITVVVIIFIPFRPPSLVTPTAELMGPFPRVKLPLKFLNGSKVPPRRLIRKRPSPTVLVSSRQMSRLAGTLQHASRECSKPFLLLQNECLCIHLNLGGNSPVFIDLSPPVMLTPSGCPLPFYISADTTQAGRKASGRAIIITPRSSR